MPLYWLDLYVFFRESPSKAAWMLRTYYVIHTFLLAARMIAMMMPYGESLAEDNVHTFVLVARMIAMMMP